MFFWADVDREGGHVQPRRDRRDGIRGGLHVSGISEARFLEDIAGAVSSNRAFSWSGDLVRVARPARYLYVPQAVDGHVVAKPLYYRGEVQPQVFQCGCCVGLPD